MKINKKQSFLKSIFCITLAIFLLNSTPKLIAVEQKQAFPSTLKVHVWNMVLRQEEDAYCGYHAAKNGKYIYNYMIGDINLPNLLKLNKRLSSSPDEKIFPLIFPLYDLIAYTMATRPPDINHGEWLDKNELKAVATLMNMPEKSLTILENIVEFNPEFITEEELIELADTIQKLQESKKVGHVFILGTMRHLKEFGQIKTTAGHWFTIGVKKGDNQLTYYVIDSLPIGTKAEDYKDYIYELTSLLQHNPQKLKLIPIQSKIIEAQNNIKNYDFTSTLKNLKEAMEYLRKHNLLTSNYFINNYKEQLKKMLTQMNEQKDFLAEQEQATLDALSF